MWLLGRISDRLTCHGCPAQSNSWGCSATAVKRSDKWATISLHRLARKMEDIWLLGASPTNSHLIDFYLTCTSPACGVRAVKRSDEWATTC